MSEKDYSTENIITINSETHTDTHTPGLGIHTDYRNSREITTFILYCQSKQELITLQQSSADIEATKRT